MPPRFDVNVSILLTEHPLLSRPAAARDAGFHAIESWWPFAQPVPPDRQVDAFAAAVEDAGVQLVALNAYGGDLSAGDRGLASLPGRDQEFRDNLDVAVGLAGRLGCPVLHVLYGRRTGDDPEGQDDLALQRLALAADAAAPGGTTVVVEALSGVPDYPLRRAVDVLRVIEALDAQGGPPVRMLCDLYHLAVNGDDVAAVVRDAAAHIGHVQVADVPGRHQPGTGTLDVAGLLSGLDGVGYRGWVGLEYVPLGDDPFGWLPRERRRGA